MKQYKVYLFDFDGTIMDTYESLILVYQHALRLIGEDCTPAQARTKDIWVSLFKL